MLDRPELNQLRRIALYVLASFSGFVIVAFFLHLAGGWRRHSSELYAELRSEKFNLLNEEGGFVSGAAFGSSRMQDAFDPRVFEATYPVPNATILNLAIAGGCQVEQRVMAELFLQKKRAQGATHARIIFELNAGVNFQAEYLTHPRTINIYDLSSTLFAAKFSGSKIPLSRRLGRAGFAWAACALHYLNVGMLSNQLTNTPLKKDLLKEQSMEGRRGVLPQDPSVRSVAVKNAYARSKSLVLEKKQGAFFPGHHSLISEIKNEFPDIKIEFFYVVSPTLASLEEIVVYPDSIDIEGQPVPVIDAARIDLYPELFQENLWHDFGHLNADGAVIFTQVIANAVKPTLR